jgi:Tannase-like family of unknown function (DUF6351)
MEGFMDSFVRLPFRAAMAACIAALVSIACGSSSSSPPRSSETSLQSAVERQPAVSGKDDDEDDRDDDVERPRVEIKTLSNRADLISGGDALVEIVLRKPKEVSQLRVHLNGRDITRTFAVRGNGRILGLVTGLAVGENSLTAQIANKEHPVRLVITNHPIGGPVIAGRQTSPFVCATPLAQPATATSPATNASGLTTNAVDAQCNIATEFKLFYRTTTAGCSPALPDPSAPAAPPANACFKPFTPGTTPADLAMTTTDQGLVVPYIVRVERGTIDRGIFDIAVLFDPTKHQTDTAFEPGSSPPAWNHKVVYTFGASTGQPRRQFRSEQNWADDSALSRGFLVIDNSMTDSLFNSNRVYNAEALMMMKEHVVETYGEIRYTIGNGCSGGSIQQLTAAAIFPGLLDGVQPTCTYPDSETTAMEVLDCVLLVNYFNSATFASFNAGLTQAQIDAKKTAIAGHLDPSSCWGWNNTFGSNGKPGQFVPSLVVNTAGATLLLGAPRNNCQLLPSQVYDAAANPFGPRCGSSDNAISIWGAAAGTTNRGRSTSDNVGIQYGLKALASRAITAEEFVALNEKIGGFTPDVDPSPSRTAADPDALTIAYRSGIVSAGQLAKTPIMDLRGFDDSTPDFGAGRVGLFGIHQIWRSFALRERLDKANGNHGNHVLWRFPTNLLAPPAFTLESFLTIDKWLANIEQDKSDLPREQKVVKNRPAGLTDFCVLSTDLAANPANPKRTTDFAQCDTDAKLVKHASPRQVAGGPIAENILKCQRKAIDFADPAYGGATFTADQQARLRAVFPNGVCDWSQPGVNQVPFAGPLTFQDGPGGKPLGPAPRSTRL